MLDNLTVVIPFFNGEIYLKDLLRGIPSEIPVVIVDDQSDIPLQWEAWMGDRVKIFRNGYKGYFSGAVNLGAQKCESDVLVLNQDVILTGTAWLDLIQSKRSEFAMIGERIKGNHPTFGDFGYIHGTFMFLRRDLIERVGTLSETLYPLWGSTAELQLRACRQGFKVLPLPEIPGFDHRRDGRFGSSIKQILERENSKKDKLVQIPPLVSVIVPCYNYGRYLSDCIHSLIGGPTSLGPMMGQTLQSFEIIIVDDASTDNSLEIARSIADQSKGIRLLALESNVGTAEALNKGIEKAVGRYITFLSADDMREPGSLQKLVEACEENPHSFVYDNIWLFGSGSRIKKWEMSEYDFEEILIQNKIHAGIMYPKQAWIETGGYPKEMGNGREDWAFNIALGVKGYCGVHVNSFGYLYRREGQNRSLRNTNPEDRKIFREKIINIFPDIYEGNRPVGCCGKSSNSRVNRNLASTYNIISAGDTMGNSIGGSGMVLIEYQGQQMSSTWTGPATNTTYRFGLDRKVGWIDSRDLGERGRSGFLNFRGKDGSWLFGLKEMTSKNISPSPTPVVYSEVVEVSAQVEEVSEISISNTSPLTAPQVEFPDPKDLTYSQIQNLELSYEQWEEVYKAELAGRNRKSVVSFLENKLIGEDS